MMPYRVVGPELPFYEYVRQNFTGLPQEVQVHPTPDRLAKLRFPINGEHPLVLVDDTIMQSAKVGILLTTNALYSLADGQRLDALADPRRPALSQRRRRSRFHRHAERPVCRAAAHAGLRARRTP